MTFVVSGADACSSSDAAQATASDLSIVSPSFELSDDNGKKHMTTFGTLKNTSADCLEEIVVEVKYSDAKNTVIDTITQPLYGIVVPPNQEVSFRVRDVAARLSGAYASQSIRVITADVRQRGNAARQSWSSRLINFLFNWGPFLLIVAIWLYLLRRMRRKDSPQERALALGEHQNALLIRILAAIEGGMSDHKTRDISS